MKFSRLIVILGTAVAQWLRCCATNRKFVVSIPDGVIGIFHWYNPSERTTALGSTQPLKEISTRRISWGKGGRCSLTNLPPLCAAVMNLGTLTSWNPLGHSWPVTGLLGTAVAQWLRCCATNRKVAGWIPDGVIGIFHWHNPSERTMALGSTQPLTEISTRGISLGEKAASR